MGLLSMLKKLKRKEREARVLLLGLDSAGKSTVLQRALGTNDAVAPTLGFDIRTVERRGVTLNVWDVGGQATIRAYWRNYFEETDAVVWVVDSADAARLELCAAGLAAVMHEEKLAGASLLVLANKRDLPGALPLARIRDALRPPGSHEFKLVPCSGVTGEGLDEALDWLVDELLARVL